MFQDRHIEYFCVVSRVNIIKKSRTNGVFWVVTNFLLQKLLFFSEKEENKFKRSLRNFWISKIKLFSSLNRIPNFFMCFSFDYKIFQKFNSLYSTQLKFESPKLWLIVSRNKRAKREIMVSVWIFVGQISKENWQK